VGDKLFTPMIDRVAGIITAVISQNVGVLFGATEVMSYFALGGISVLEVNDDVGRYHEKSVAYFA